MHQAYTAIFTRLGLKFRSVVADPGAIGGSGSEEFHVLADSGEDAIAFSDGDSYAANHRDGRGRCRRQRRARAASAPLTEVATPGAKTIDDVTALLKLPASTAGEDPAGRRHRRRRRGAAGARRPRAQRRQGAEAAGRREARCAWRRTTAIATATGAEAGFLGPVGFKGRIYADHSVVALRRFRLRRQQEGCAPHRRELGPRPARSRLPPTSATSCPATLRLPARARCRSRAASRSATSSSSAGSTARPWAPRCWTNPARPPRCTWAATASV